MARECSFRRLSVVPAPAASHVHVPVPDSVPRLPDTVADVNPSISENEAAPDYVLSSTSGPCSGDEEVLRSVPTSALVALARKHSALPAVPSGSAESFVDNELSPESVPDPVPGMPEPASAVAVPDPVTVPNPVPGTPVSASAVVVPDVSDKSPFLPPARESSGSKPRKKKPRSSQGAAASASAESTPVKSFPVESAPVKSTPASVKSTPVAKPRRRTFWEVSRCTGFGYVVDDGTGATVRFDFGRFSRSIEIDSTSFEYDRFVKYVHHGVGVIPVRPPATVYLSAGTPLEFPKPSK